MGARVDDLLRSSMAPSTQRMLMLTKLGGPDGFAVVERPVPEPGVGEILVKVLAASVQFTDVILRKGQSPDLKAIFGPLLGMGLAVPILARIPSP
jgi:NADPH:quinone reductase-like Zn-dependent oxidoreductase